MTLPAAYSNEIPGFFGRLYREIDEKEKGTFERPSLTRQVSFHAHETLVHAALYNAKTRPNHELLQWVDAQNNIVDRIDYLKLWRRASTVATLLKNKGVEKGDRVMISYPPGLEFLAGVLGCMTAGAIACSVYPPNLVQSSAKATHSLQQFRTQASDAGAKFALTTKKFKLLVTLRALGRTNVTWLSTDDLPESPELPDASHIQLPGAQDIAIIQYSSGSTGNPKGIKLSHGAIVYNMTAIRRISVDPENANTHGVSWLPQYHDYGLFNFFLVAVMTPLFTATCASPIDFIKDPLLWLNMIEKYKATHTAAPNFAYGLLAKRMKAANRKLQPEIAKRWFRTNIAAEPIAPQTIEDMVHVIGFPRRSINPTYGLAENCVYVTACIGPEMRIHEGVVSCGMVQRSQDQGKQFVIVQQDDEEGTIAPEGQVGEIHVRGPDLASGYWGKPGLDHLFRQQLSDGNHYLGTGDLGKIVDGRLYVVGRIKELIINNGRNIYPTDLERTVEEAYPSIVRPGSTVAFEWSATDVALVCEIRDGVTKEQTDEISNSALQVLLRNAHDVDLGAIYLLQRGCIPKTTSGKVKRVETKDKTFAGSWKMRMVIRKWNKPAVVLTTTTVSPALEVPRDLPTDSFPESARMAVAKIQVNPDKLEKLFRDMHLHETAELAQAWQQCDKSNEAFHAMCNAAMDAIEQNIPTVVQFTHLLAQQSDMSTMISGDPGSILDDLLHAGFVLEWATVVLSSDIDLLYRKVQKDKEIEQQLTKGLERTLVPKEGRFLTRGAKTDPLYGALDTFGWLKHRSVDLMMDQMLRIIRGEATCSDTEALDGVDFGTMNILEATWVDSVFRRMENATVGSWVALRSKPLSTKVVNGLFHRHFEHQQWAHVYKAWNLAFSMTLPESKWVLAKLLIPSIAKASNLTFTTLRLISLHCAAHNFVREHLKGTESAGVVTREGQVALGVLNRRWIEEIGLDESRDWVDSSQEPPPSVKKWGQNFHKIDGGHRNKEDTAASGLREEYDEVESFFQSLLGDSVAMSATWEENGLTSMMHVELCNAVAEKYFVTLPPTFYMVFKTPNELKEYINGQSRVPFPVNLPYLDDNQLPKDIRTVSKTYFRICSCLGIIALVIAFLASFIPLILLSAVISNLHISYQIAGSPVTLQLFLLPIGVPLFALVISLVVIAIKWTVVGRYRSTEMACPSVSYLQYWFVDRAVHLWEFWVGRFLVDTKFACIFYRLMGANIHYRARLSAFVREFDLVTIGESASVSHPISCRRFGPWLEGAPGPTLRLRPVVIGKGCNIRGMVSAGGEIGKGASVEPMAVVPEGAQVPYNVVARGNPACGGGKTEAISLEWRAEVIVETAKLVWLSAELYLLYAVIGTSWNLWRDLIPSSFRYHSLVQGMCLIPTVTIILIVISVLLKWVLIGRRAEGSPGTTWSRVIDWCVDFHYQTSIFLLCSITGCSRLWNIVMKLHGLDIDLYSYIADPVSFPPSKVDCIRVHKSFVSYTPSFETGPEKTEIVKSSVGAQVSFAAGVQAVRSMIGPLTRLEDSIYDAADTKAPVTRQPGGWLLELLNLCTLPFLAATFAPAFEVIQLVVQRSWGNWTLPFVVGVLLFLQLCTWTLCLQPLAHSLLNGAPHWLGHPIYTLHLNSASSCSSCCWFLLWGTPFMPLLLTFLGSRVQGDIWYNGGSLQGFADLTFAGRTVLDTCNVSSHVQKFGQLRVSPTKVAGLLHPETHVQGCCNLASDREYGPYCALLHVVSGNSKETPENSAISCSTHDDFDA